MIAVLVDIQRVSGRAVLLTNWTYKAPRIHVLGLHVHFDHGAAVGGKATSSTSELHVLPSVHE